MFQTFPRNRIYKREPITAVTGGLLLWCGKKYRNSLVHVQKFFSFWENFCGKTGSKVENQTKEFDVYSLSIRPAVTGLNLGAVAEEAHKDCYFVMNATRQKGKIGTGFATGIKVVS